MKNIIISGFPGIGKSTLVDNNKTNNTIYDVDSSSFSWIIDKSGNKTRNPNFVVDYVKHIHRLYHSLSTNGYSNIILVSSHELIINALIYYILPFLLVYPNLDRKEEFLKIYEEREKQGHPLPLKVAQEQWDYWIKSCQQIECNKLELNNNVFLLDVMDNILGKL